MKEMRQKIQDMYNAYLEESDLKMIDDWIKSFSVIDVALSESEPEPYFTHSPAFGLACTVMDCVVDHINK